MDFSGVFVVEAIVVKSGVGFESSGNMWFSRALARFGQLSRKAARSWFKVVLSWVLDIVMVSFFFIFEVPNRESRVGRVERAGRESGF